MSHISSEFLIYQGILGIISTQNGENVSRFFCDNFWNFDKEISPSSKKLNYHEKHYVVIAQQAGVFKKEEIEDWAKENLSAMGEVYRYESYLSTIMPKS